MKIQSLIFILPLLLFISCGDNSKLTGQGGSSIGDSRDVTVKKEFSKDEIKLIKDICGSFVYYESRLPDDKSLYNFKVCQSSCTNSNDTCEKTGGVTSNLQLEVNKKASGDYQFEVVSGSNDLKFFDIETRTNGLLKDFCGEPEKSKPLHYKEGWPTATFSSVLKKCDGVEGTICFVKESLIKDPLSKNKFIVNKIDRIAVVTANGDIRLGSVMRYSSEEASSCQKGFALKKGATRVFTNTNN